LCSGIKSIFRTFSPSRGRKASSRVHGRKHCDRGRRSRMRSVGSSNWRRGLLPSRLRGRSTWTAHHLEVGGAVDTNVSADHSMIQQV
jgi:hypothetical protein